MCGDSAQQKIYVEREREMYKHIYIYIYTYIYIYMYGTPDEPLLSPALKRGSREKRIALIINTTLTIDYYLSFSLYIYIYIYLHIHTISSDRSEM